MNKEYFIQNIKKYSNKLEYDAYANNIPNYTFTKDERFIVSYIQRMLPIICKQYLNGERSAKDLTDKANYIMFSKYEPLVLSRLLKRDLYNFIFDLGEADIYLEPYFSK